MEPEEREGPPPVGEVFSATMTEFMENLGPYAFAGLGQTLVLVPLALAIVLGSYVFLLGSVLGLGVAGGTLASFLPSDLAALGAGATVAVTLAGSLVIFVVVLGLGLSLTAPFNASLLRAIDAHQRGDRPLDFTAAFRHALQDLPATLLVMLLTVVPVMLGAFLCYLPGILLGGLLCFGLPLVALDRRRPVEALGASIAHARTHLTWHASFAGLYLLSTLLGGYVPILGPAFTVALLTRGTRAAFPADLGSR